MPKEEVTVPEAGESITEVTIRLIIDEGAIVQRDDVIAEADTEKATGEIFAPNSGKVHFLCSDGDTLEIGAPIAEIDTDVKAPAPQKVESKPPPKKEAPKEPEPTKVVPLPSGPGARQSTSDYVESLSKPVIKEPSVTTPVASGERREKMSKLRKVIAKRLVEVKNKTALLTTFNEVDMTHIINVRNEHKDRFFKEHDVKLSFMSFFTVATIGALKALPALNASIDGDEIVYQDHMHIGIAVGTPKGLVVPVVKNADTMTFIEVEKKIAELAKRARDGKLSMDDMSNGSFTITNGGVYGSLLSTPILNPPQSGILGMHSIQKRPVAIGNEIHIRPMMYLALSYDHRIVDGKESVTFLVKLKEYLENPTKLLIEGGFHA